MAAVSLMGLQSGARAMPPTRVVATAGIGATITPGISGGQFSMLGAPQLDGAGGVLVTCRFTGPDVVYSSTDLGLFHFDRFGRGTLLARTGVSGATPGSVDGEIPGATFSATFFPRLRDDGGVAAVCFLAGSGIDSSNSTGYWTGDHDGISLAIRSGSTSVPGVPGAQFNGFITGFPCVLSNSGMAFGAQMAVGAGNVTIADYQGIWGPSPTQPGQITLVARPGIVGGLGLAGAPPLSSSLAAPAYLNFNSRSLVLSGNGRMAWGATLAPSAQVDASNDTVIVERRPDGSLNYVAREGSEVPGYPGVLFKSLDVSAFVQSGGISINSAGDIAFCEIDGSDVPSTGVSRVWRRHAGGQYEILAARSVGIGPGTPTGIVGAFSTLLPPALNSAGATVFAGTVTTPANGTVSGLWYCEATSVSPRLILRTDVADTLRSPPGLPGALFSTELPPRGTYRLNARGQVLFRWKLQEGPGGITSSTGDGLWAYDPATGALLSVARAGDAVDLGSGLTPTIRSIGEFLGPGGDDDGRIRDLNELGECAYTVQFSDVSGAILVSQLPGTGACCLGGTCVVASIFQCIGPNSRFAGIGAACSGPAPACCMADFTQNGTLAADDIFAYLNAWFSGNPEADVNGVPGLNADDIFAFMSAWFQGC